MAAWGVYCVLKTPVDAIPDLSENQVIVFTDWMGRSPQEIDDQITYPLSVNMQGLAGVKAVRSSSEFNFSMITIIFDEGTDFYFARTRVQERLSASGTYLPAGVVPYMAPDATALGQIFWYTVEGDGYDPEQLRTIQDWYVRNQLKVSGVAEVASAGGFVREYQIDVDPGKLRAYNVSLGSVYDAVARSNISVGGKVFYEAHAEFLIRGVGWLRGVRDIENVVVAERKGVPIYVKNLAAVQLGPEFRRSMLEKNGKEAVGGVVMMRYGENPLTVTKAIKARIEELQPGLPPGVRIVPFYDRTRLIEGAIHTLTGTLWEEIIIASLAILLILTHFRSAFVVCITLPLAMLVSFIFMYYLNIPSNIMSLSGLAISIGILIDASVVMVENATHELTKVYGDKKITGDTTEIVVKASRLVGKPIFFAVVIMLISFLPVFALTGQEGKMFHPLAFTKSFAMVGVALLSITFVPAIIPMFIKGRLRREEDNWIVRSFINIYKPVLTWLMHVPAAGLWFISALVIVGLGLAGLFGNGASWVGLAILGGMFLLGTAFFRRLWSRGVALVLLVGIAVWAWNLPKLGREFMPPLDEGSLMDMPMSVPRVSIAEAADDLKVRDAVMRGFPEVDQVVGKTGRADTPTDPAGVDMVETIVTLRPKEWWPKRGMRLNDVLAQTRKIVAEFQARGYVKGGLTAAQVDTLATSAATEALTGFNHDMRELARKRQDAAQEGIARQLVTETLDALLQATPQEARTGRTLTADQREVLISTLTKDHGLLLVESARQEEMNKLVADAGKQLVDAGVVKSAGAMLSGRLSVWETVRDAVKSAAGGAGNSMQRGLMTRWEAGLDAAWRDRVQKLNWEIQDAAAQAMAARLLTAVQSNAKAQEVAARNAGEAELSDLRTRTVAPLFKSVFLWRKTKEEVKQEMDDDLQMPGWGNTWTQPIINRVEMLATGVRTDIGIKVFGPRLFDVTEKTVENGKTKLVVKEEGIQTIADEVAAVINQVPGVDGKAYPEQVGGRRYLQINIDREKAARYGVNVSDVSDAIEVAMGGKTIMTTVEGQQRFPVRVRYGQDFWQTEDALRNTLVTGRRGTPTPSSGGGAGEGMAAGGGGGGGSGMGSDQIIQVPIHDVADIQVVEGPNMIKSENGSLRAYVLFNVAGRDIVGFVEDAQRAVAEKVKLPPGFHIEWAGKFENEIHARKTLQIVFPLVILLIFVILYITFNDFHDALLIIIAVPGALAGGIIFQSLFGFNFSVAVWVGYIACFGMATQTGIVMLVYLHDAINSRGGLAKIATEAELTQAIITGAVHRLRPKLMTEGVAIVGLMPMLWATGVGAEVIKPMAAPVLGGLLVADEVIDLLLPVVFNWYQVRRWRALHQPVEADAVVGADTAVQVAGS